MQTSSSYQAIDLAVVISANIFNLMVVAIFLLRTGIYPGFITLTTYLLSLGASGYSYSRVGHGRIPPGPAVLP